VADVEADIAERVLGSLSLLSLMVGSVKVGRDGAVLLLNERFSWLYDMCDAFVVRCRNVPAVGCNGVIDCDCIRCFDVICCVLDVLKVEGLGLRVAIVISISGVTRQLRTVVQTSNFNNERIGLHLAHSASANPFKSNSRTVQSLPSGLIRAVLLQRPILCEEHYCTSATLGTKESPIYPFMGFSSPYSII
jgi:hypothetical protein